MNTTNSDPTSILDPRDLPEVDVAHDDVIPVFIDDETPSRPLGIDDEVDADGATMHAVDAEVQTFFDEIREEFTSANDGVRHMRMTAIRFFLELRCPVTQLDVSEYCEIRLDALESEEARTKLVSSCWAAGAVFFLFAGVTFFCERTWRRYLRLVTDGRVLEGRV